MMKILRQNISSSELLFKKLPEAFDYHEEYADAATDIIEAKGVFDGLLGELKQALIKKPKTHSCRRMEKKLGKSSPCWIL